MFFALQWEGEGSLLHHTPNEDFITEARKQKPPFSVLDPPWGQWLIFYEGQGCKGHPL